ncbi:MAG: hypothetical protein ABEJ05_11085 [Haloglomus sp.]
MSHPVYSRRSVLASIGAGLVATVGAGSVTATETTTVEEQLATVREATAKYIDPKVAMREGFTPTGPYVPGQGWHFIHQKRLKRAAKNGPSLSDPPILTYFDTGNRLVLGAAEFGVPIPNPQGYDAENPPQLFDVEEASGDGMGGDGMSGEGDSGGGHHGGDGHGGGKTPSWHVHGTAQHLYADGNGSRTNPGSITAADLLTRDRWTEIPGESGIEPGDAVTADWGLTGTETTRVVDLAPPPHPDLLTLHAWVHTENPRGPFAGTNPVARYIERLPPEMYSDETIEPQG